MNLTTRAAQTACAEPAIALRRLHLQSTDEAAREQCVVPTGAAAGQVQPLDRPHLSEPERFGLVLLGIGYETSVAQLRRPE